MKNTALFAIFVATILNLVSPASIAAEQSLKPHKKIKSLWKYESHKDEMSGEIVYTAEIKSSNLLQFDFPYQGGVFGWLALRKHPEHGNSVIFWVDKGQILCNSYEPCIVRIKFDEDQPQEFRAFPPSDHSPDTLFIDGYNNLVEKLKTASSTLVEVTFYQEGTRKLKFKTAGLKWDTAKQITKQEQEADNEQYKLHPKSSKFKYEQ